MLFNSYAFIFLFLPITFAGMFWLSRHSHRLASLWLGMASLTFYAVWDTRFILLLLGSIVFNYGAGYWISMRRHAVAKVGKQARYSLAIAISVNLLLLGYFKYSNFFIASTNTLLGSSFPALDIILPLGISFFTFTQIAFLVDVYRGITREVDFIHYLLFVTWFPHLIAGPVIHHKQMMPQFALASTYRINMTNVVVGLNIFVLGLAKKVLLADSLAEFATPVFAKASAGHTLMMLDAWSGALAYTLQLYFDFSGYSDMAIGLSLMFNVRLPLNFNSPYKSTNIIDFWRRWHMTLSAFLRDYLYFPLGGNRKGKVRRYLNLMATMLLGGLWHGAGWTYVVWGGLHGLYLALNHGWRSIKTRYGWGDGGRIGKLLGGILTFLSVVVAWVFFRSDSLVTAKSILFSMAGLNGMMNKWVPVREALLLILPCLLLVWLSPNVQQIMRHYKPSSDLIADQSVPMEAGRNSSFISLAWQPVAGWAWALGSLFLLCVISLTKVSEFLYFQF